MTIENQMQDGVAGVPPLPDICASPRRKRSKLFTIPGDYYLFYFHFWTWQYSV